MTRRSPSAGFTLVELMVALVLSLLLGVAMLKMQGSLAQQTVRTFDAGVRDEQWRTAVDLITRNVSSAGFVLGGTQKPCNEMFTYNSAATSTSKYFTHHAVDSAAASNGLKLPYAIGLSLNYPPAGSPIVSDILAVTTSNNATNFNNAVSPVVAVFSNSAYTPSTTGLIPVQTTSGLGVNDMAVLQVGLSNRIACIRMKMTVFSTSSGSPNVQAGGTFIDTGSYFSGFATSMGTAGYPAMTNASIFQGQLVDLSPNLSAVTQVFYIDGSTYAFPVLMTAQYDFRDDTLVAGSAQIVAAGAISLQVRYGVDPGKTGAVTAYESAATVQTNNHWDVVRTVKVLLVTRSLANDTSTAADGTLYSAPALTFPTLLGGASTDQFTAVAIPAGYTQRHYAVNVFEVAERNVLWNCAFSSVCVP
jgi:type IV pilus assembly protein PilW